VPPPITISYAIGKRVFKKAADIAALEQARVEDRISSLDKEDQMDMKGAMMWGKETKALMVPQSQGRR
jgi:hypothetical protein